MNNSTSFPDTWYPPEESVDHLSGQMIPQKDILYFWSLFRVVSRQDGLQSSDWALDFIEFAKKRWEHHKHLGRFAIPEKWQPQLSTLDLVDMLGMDRIAAIDSVTFFHRYWRDSRQERHDWDKIFLRFTMQKQGFKQQF